MQTFTIICTLTDEQVAELEKKLGTLSVADYFQRFWDGYISEGIQMDGAVWAQTKQYLLEQIQGNIAESPILKKMSK